MNIKNNLLIISDLHLGNLGYSEYIKDSRISEKKEIFDFIIEQSKDSKKIIFLGDIFNTKNPLSETIKEFTSFLERFDNKEIYIISGNHCLKANGETALDYLKEVKNHNWHIITDKPTKIGDMVFAPYLTRNLLSCDDNKSATKKLMGMLPDGKILFHHYSMSDSKTTSGGNTDFFDEIVLSRKELKKRYEFVFGGHIHMPSEAFDPINIIVAGSIFCNEMGETEKYVWKLDVENNKVEQIKLPGRGIYKMEDPTIEILNSIEKGNIVKIIFTKKPEKEELDKIKEVAEKFDAFILVFDIPHERKKISLDNKKNIIDLNINDLLEIYSKEKNIDLIKLKAGFELIRK
jgi:DNA repair exonuclease SbcCD nuclease subunit